MLVWSPSTPQECSSRLFSRQATAGTWVIYQAQQCVKDPVLPPLQLRSKMRPLGTSMCHREAEGKKKLQPLAMTQIKIDYLKFSSFICYYLKVHLTLFSIYCGKLLLEKKIIKLPLTFYLPLFLETIFFQIYLQPDCPDLQYFQYNFLVHVT